MSAFANGDQSRFTVEPAPDDRDMSKHYCGKCHGNPACGQVKGDPVKLAAWVQRKAYEKWARENPLEAELDAAFRASQVVPYAEDHGV